MHTITASEENADVRARENENISILQLAYSLPAVLDAKHNEKARSVITSRSNKKRRTVLALSIRVIFFPRRVVQ